MLNKSSKIVGVVLISSLVLFSCTEESKKTTNSPENKEEVKEVSEKENGLLELEGKVFSIPSPIQTAFILKESGASFSADLLNNSAAVANYESSSSKALNLGIYGADLGYATIFNKSQETLEYLAVAKKLSSDLGISNLFDKTMMERFEANIDNQDSLLTLVSDAFKSSDSYLKDNDHADISAMILAGGWIETLHLVTSINNLEANQTLTDRIGEQKITIDNLIKILLPFNESSEVSTLSNQLNELKDLYSNVEFNYTFVEPTTDEENKVTTINSESHVVISKEQLNAITNKINEIRTNIVK